MTVQDPTPDVAVPDSPPPARSVAAAAVRWLLAAQIFLLLALAQILFAGYRVGVGNQSIQIPFLKHFVDPQLYANDPMLRQTLADYPSYFFRLLAPLVARFDLYSVYFTLHVLTAAAVFFAAYELGRAIFNSRATGAVLVLLMLAGHHRALAGDDLYSVGFTHTFAVFPLALLAMALLYRGHVALAFALVGLTFNLHALTAAYLLVMFGTWAVFYYRREGWPWRLILMLVCFAALAAPTLREMLAHRQTWGPDWLAHTRTRSADHSFPSTWWTDGATDIPRFVLLLGLAAVSLSFAAARDAQRKTLMIAAAAGILFLAGWIFTDLFPVATVVRAQLFRSSRLIVVLMLAHIAHAIVQGWLAAAGRPAEPEPDPIAVKPTDSSVGSPEPLPVILIEPLNPLARALELLLALTTFTCLAVPGLFALAPWLLLASLIVALVTARLAWHHALAASLCLLVVLAAWRTIEFHIPGIDGRVSLEAFRQSLKTAGPPLAIAAAVAAAAFLFLRLPIGPRARLCAAVAVGFVCGALALRTARTLAASTPDEQRAWVAAQEWAAAHTPKSALFLTPPQQGGFRIRSDRAVVCEWRDGTQLYFSAAYARDWWDKLQALRPSGSAAASRGIGELMKSKTLETMPDGEVERLAKSYGASYVVLPASANTRRDLKLAYRNAKWAIYEPRVLDEEDAFIENVAKPNIEKYRKSDVRLELADAAGRPLADGQYEIRQTRQAFGFGVSLPFFADPAGDSGPDFEPPPVTARQLERVKGVFNYSVIPFSAKWQRLEPDEGKWDFAELDKYVDWCTKHGVTMEFHYLGGFTPHWARRLGSEGMKKAWLEHCRVTFARYQDRIKYWQVTNDKYLIDWCAQAMKEARAKYPHLKLGISDCSKFASPYGGTAAASDMMIGADELEQLQAEGAKADFFSTHGHKPMGGRFDLRQVYECIDAFAKHGVKVHVSEATLDPGLRMVSASRSGSWTQESAAEFYGKFYTVLFANPAMEAINYWDLGPSIVRPGGRGFNSLSGTGQAGLLDPDNNDAPRPIYNTLKHLITQEWMTRLSGQTPATGPLTFRGFHGDYEITLTTPAGKKLRATFTVTPEGPNTHQLKLTEPAAPIAKGS